VFPSSFIPHLLSRRVGRGARGFGAARAAISSKRGGSSYTRISHTPHSVFPASKTSRRSLEDVVFGTPRTWRRWRFFETSTSVFHSSCSHACTANRNGAWRLVRKTTWTMLKVWGPGQVNSVHCGQRDFGIRRPRVRRVAFRPGIAVDDAGRGHHLARRPRAMAARGGGCPACQVARIAVGEANQVGTVLQELLLEFLDMRPAQGPRRDTPLGAHCPAVPAACPITAQVSMTRVSAMARWLGRDVAPGHEQVVDILRVERPERN